MTYKEIASMVASMGLSYAYRFFPEESCPDLPYIVFWYPDNDDFGADNINYAPIVNVRIELYTEEKDFTKESTVESVLTNNGFFYEKSETYLSTEHMYMVLYEIQSLID